MIPEGFTPDPTGIDDEIAMLERAKKDVERGYIEVFRDREERLVFHVTPAGIAHLRDQGRQP